ncbi:MAG: flagellar filament capping protein FliD [Treponema sp.]|jgi:flagellar hook-associated protein 2|nr:flagellar filament capping protein FliD [Treponema sp.]
MSDVYIPGVKSRFDTEKIIQDLMKVERVPKERVEKNVESLETEKTYWQEIGRRINTLRDSARQLYSFQNPFNERLAFSSDESAITGTATREAAEEAYHFTVKQQAQADRFLSSPLDEKFTVEKGTYTFSVGNEEISFNFRGGSLGEFADALNRRGRDKIAAGILTVQPGSKSFLIESKVTGAENRLGFSGDAAALALRMGMVEQGNDTRRDIAINEGLVQKSSPAQDGARISVNEGILLSPAGTSGSIPFSLSVSPDSRLVLKLETSTKVKNETLAEIPQPPPGPDLPSAGSVSYGGIVIENDPSQTPLPEWKPPEAPPRVDNLAVLSLVFSDGTRTILPPIGDSGGFDSHQYQLGDIAGGKTLVSLDIGNNNTHRDISLRKIEVSDPAAISGGLRPLNAVSTARDAIISMEGIEMIRPSNTITDIIPGVTVTIRGASDRPVSLDVRPDRQAVKDSLISLAGNYNRLMAELNVLTRADDRIIEELTYLSPEEKAEMKKRQGAFSGDSTLNQFKSRLQRTVGAPYSTDEERNLALLTQIGIGVDVRRSGGAYDPSRLRGYLEIDEKVLDAALETKLSAVRQLFGSDTDGDLLTDTGVAYNLETITRPFVENGGIITLKTGTIDSRISQDKRRIETMERQLAAKEMALKVQYGRMEGAYNRMEQMTSSLENFNQRNNNNR